MPACLKARCIAGEGRRASCRLCTGLMQTFLHPSDNIINTCSVLLRPFYCCSPALLKSVMDGSLNVGMKDGRGAFTVVSSPEDVKNLKSVAKGEEPQFVTGDEA